MLTFALLLCPVTWADASQGGILRHWLLCKCGQYRFPVKHIPILWQLRTHSGRGHIPRAWEVGEMYASRVCRLPFGSIIPCPSLREWGWHGLAQPLLALMLLPAYSDWQPAPLAWRVACPAHNRLTCHFPFLQAFLIWGFVCWTPCRRTGGLTKQTLFTGLLLCYNVQKYYTFQRHYTLIIKELYLILTKGVSDSSQLMSDIFLNWLAFGSLWNQR